MTNTGYNAAVQYQRVLGSRTINSLREGPAWITTLEAGDGEKAIVNARVQLSYGPKTPVATVLRARELIGEDVATLPQSA